jgi:hypothetical protein
VNVDDLLVGSDRWRLASLAGRARWLGDDERCSESGSCDLSRVWDAECAAA